MQTYLIKERAGRLVSPMLFHNTLILLIFICSVTVTVTIGISERLYLMCVVD